MATKRPNFRTAALMWAVDVCLNIETSVLNEIYAANIYQVTSNKNYEKIMKVVN